MSAFIRRASAASTRPGGASAPSPDRRSPTTISFSRPAARTTTSATSGLQAATSGMKTLRDALALRNHALACLERAAQAVSDEERRWLTFLVVGGGPTGTEYAGALKELLRLVLGRDYPELRPDLARIVLAEGHDRLLGTFREARTLRRVRAREARVDVMTGRLVTDAGTDTRGSTRITIKTTRSSGRRASGPTSGRHARRRAERIEPDQRRRAPAPLPTASSRSGISPRSTSAASSCRCSPRRQCKRGATSPERFSRRSPGRGVARALPLPGQGNDGNGRAKRGRCRARALRLTGFLAWVSWLFVHLYYLIGFRNRARSSCPGAGTTCGGPAD